MRENRGLPLHSIIKTIFAKYLIGTIFAEHQKKNSRPQTAVFCLFRLLGKIQLREGGELVYLSRQSINGGVTEHRTVSF